LGVLRAVLKVDRALLRETEHFSRVIQDLSWIYMAHLGVYSAVLEVHRDFLKGKQSMFSSVNWAVLRFKGELGCFVGVWGPLADV